MATKPAGAFIGKSECDARVNEMIAATITFFGDWS